MNRRCRAAALALGLGLGPPLPAEAPAPAPGAEQKARGTFDVELTPQSTDESAGGAALGRMSLVKRFHGDLDATSKGEMLTAMTAVQGSAGYVAIERIEGTLHGRSGSFALQHSGTMTRGAPQLAITVVPDSGTGQLAGLAGKMTIDIAADGQHSYELDYTLEPAGSGGR